MEYQLAVAAPLSLVVYNEQQAIATATGEVEGLVPLKAAVA